MGKQYVVFDGPYNRWEIANAAFQNSDLILLELSKVKDSPEVLDKTVAIWIELKTSVDKSVLEKFKNLKFIFCSTTSIKHLDVNYILSRGIEIISLNKFPSIVRSVTSTSELTWALVLAVWRKLLIYNQKLTLNPGLINDLREQVPTYEIQSRNLGLIGFGRIGNQISGYGHAFGMNVAYYDPYVSSLEDYKGGCVRKMASMEDLIADSDVVVICASTIDGQTLVGQRQIRLMKTDAVIINTARASLWDEQAIKVALEEKRIAGVGVDVYDYEEFQSKEVGSVLIELDPYAHNVVSTPHIGGATTDALNRVTLELSREIVELLETN
jgi:phosphoglycerate dehydrogenase-like enzyme